MLQPLLVSVLASGQWIKGLLEMRGQREWEAKTFHPPQAVSKIVQVPFLLAISPHCSAASCNPPEKLGLGHTFFITSSSQILCSESFCAGTLDLDV